MSKKRSFFDKLTEGACPSRISVSASRRAPWSENENEATAYAVGEVNNSSNATAVDPTRTRADGVDAIASDSSLTDAVAKRKRSFTLKTDSEGREALGGDQTLEQAERMWKRAFERADAQAQTVTENENAAREGGDGVQYSLIGKTADGIEVYETSEEVKNFPYKERMEKFLDIMRNQYRGRTAKFSTENDVYYAKFDEADLLKNVYGDKKSSPRGWRAKINTGADGEIFELVENAQYKGSDTESGKASAAHKGVTGWEYFVKTVQIDWKVYDLLANVRKKPDGEYVYSIQLNENKKKTPAPPRQYQDGTAKAENRPVGVPTDVSDGSITDADENSKRKFSLKTDSEGRALSEQQFSRKSTEVRQQELIEYLRWQLKRSKGLRTCYASPA